MENILREIDKSYESCYICIWIDYMNRKKELTSIIDPKLFSERFVEAIMILHQLYVSIDIMFSKNMISVIEYETARKILDTEKEWFINLLSYKIYK